MTQSIHFHGNLPRLPPCFLMAHLLVIGRSRFTEEDSGQITCILHTARLMNLIAFPVTKRYKNPLRPDVCPELPNKPNCRRSL